LIPHIFLVGQSLRKVDLPCLNEAQSSEREHKNCDFDISHMVCHLSYPLLV
jgi:hypothetical protein